MTVTLLVPHGHPADRVSDEVLADQLTRSLHAQVSSRWTAQARTFSTQGASASQLEAAAEFWLPQVPWLVVKGTADHSPDGDRLVAPPAGAGLPAVLRAEAGPVVHQRGLGQVQVLCCGGGCGQFGWVRPAGEVSCPRCVMAMWTEAVVRVVTDMARFAAQVERVAQTLARLGAVLR